MSAKPVHIARTAHFCKHYATRILASSTEFDVRLVLTNEKTMRGPGEEFYVSEAMCILTPTAAKELAKSLAKTVREYETEHGKIPERPKGSRFTEMKL